MSVSQEHRDRVLAHLEQQAGDPFAKIEYGPPRRVADDLRNMLRVAVNNTKRST